MACEVLLVFLDRLKKLIDMEIGDLLSKEELSAIKGGGWVYDEETDEWYWIEDGRNAVPYPFVR